MKFSLFFIAEYANMVTASSLMATLFFGGWDVPFTKVDNLGGAPGWMVFLSIAIYLAKVMFFLFFFMWIRWTLPRFRYDQLMSLGWKVMLPMALAYIVVVAALILGLDAAGIPRGFLYAAIMFGVNVVILFLTFWVLDRGRLVSPSYGRATPAQIASLRAVSARRTHLTTADVRD
jgi:NADH-quinone oxidoreductase subunit H